MPSVRATAVESLDDRRIADYALLRDPTRLKGSGLFVAEGRLVVGRLLGAERFRVRSLLVSAAAFAALRETLDRTRGLPEIYLAPLPMFEHITGFNIHRGCLAIAERPADIPLERILASTDLVVVVERLVDADNIGSIFRNASAFGAGAVLTSPGCCDPFYRKAVKTSSGAVFQVPSAQLRPWPQVLLDLKAHGFRVVALTPRGADRDIAAFVGSGQPRHRLALLVGTEGDGLSDEAAALADECVRIPMRGGTDSLNVATAAAIALHRVFDARRSA